MTTATETTQTVMGYTVTPGGNSLVSPHRDKVAYFLTGKRGAVYGLLRHTGRPELMFVVNSYGNICGLKGNYTWTDKDGSLRPWYHG